MLLTFYLISVIWTVIAGGFILFGITLTFSMDTKEGKQAASNLTLASTIAFLIGLILVAINCCLIS